MEEKKPREYRFLNEETKEIPKNWKKFGRKLGMVIFFAAVFGVVACLVFSLLRPVMGKEIAESQKQNEPSDSVSEDVAEEIPEQVFIHETEEMTVADYENLRTQLYTIGRNADRSVVEIKSVTNEKDWFQDDYEKEGEGSGIIIKDTGSEILILTEIALIQDASRIDVNFYGNDLVTARMKAYDGATGIAVLSVDKKDLGENTNNLIRAVKLGSTSRLVQGMFVIGVGSPLGEAHSVLVGNLTSSDRQASVTDANYRLFTTDMAASSTSRGVLLNTDGEIIGLIHQNPESQTLEALAISELNGLIERLSAGQNMAYLGLQISEVTKAISEEYGLPQGVYIKSVEMDSPAVTAGLQEGDVIVKMNGVEVTTESQYEEKLQSMQKDQKLNITVKRQAADGQYQDVTCKAEIKIVQ